MPSIKVPTSVVVPGAGRLPAATISASAFIVPGGGSGGAMAALQAHINDPVDAHMAGAIGIPAVNPITLEPLLESNVPPGVIDGESVLDFITQFKDLIPARPNSIGVAGFPNSGVPYWGNLTTGRTGGYNNGTTVTYTHCVMDSAVANFAVSGTLYPADRGVLALYSTPDGDFTNPFASATLEAALYLGTTFPALSTPTGIPIAGFNETQRTTGQGDYNAMMMGLDKISLTYRLPYLTSYGPGVPYLPYDLNFYSYQLATYTIDPQMVAAGNNQNWFLVHWRSTFATDVTAITPVSLTLASLSPNNCYSAVPSAVIDFDDQSNSAYNIARHNVWVDTASNTVPSVFAITTAITATTHKTSGLDIYDAIGGVDFNYSVTLDDLFNTAFQTGRSAPVPAILYSALDPVQIIVSMFGDDGTYAYRFDELENPATMMFFSDANPPATGDQGQRNDTAFSVAGTASPYTVNNFFSPYSQFLCSVRNLYLIASGADTAKKYLFNSWDQTGGAGGQATPNYDMTVIEKCVDESYRYLSTHVPMNTDTVLPAAMDAYDNTVVLTADDENLQVLGSCIGYPQIDFSAGGYDPAGPDYSALPGTDTLPARRYLRAFDTGMPRNTGKTRLRGLALAAFKTDAAYDGSEFTGHVTGGAAIQLMIPGVTGWLDLGRDLGDPVLGTSDFYGCLTGVLVDGPDLIVSYQTTAFTVNNGAGEFPLFVRVSLLNSAAGLALSLDELEWQAS